AEALIEEAKARADEMKFYVAASKAFQAIILCQYAKYYVELISHGEEALADVVEEVRYLLDMARNVVNSSTVITINALELLLAAKIRLREAEEIYDEAIRAYRKGDYAGSMYRLAFSKWRAVTAIEWFKVAVRFGAGAMVNLTSLKTLIENYLYEALTVSSYAYTVLSQAGAMSEALQLAEEAMEFVDKAKESFFKGDLLLSLAESIEALSRASVAMNLLNINPQALRLHIELLSRLSLISIHECLNANILPFMALCYQEYALEIRDPAVSMIFYRSSAIYAKILLSLLGVHARPAEIVEKPSVSPSRKPSSEGSSHVREGSEGYLSEVEELINELLRLFNLFTKYLYMYREVVLTCIIIVLLVVVTVLVLAAPRRTNR
ncbi:MAG: hypothetical protein DRM97_04825, partial [Thermoprotei archaeon]